MKLVLCIPTLDAANHAAKIIDSIASQSLQPNRVLVIDSSSTDDSTGRFRSAGFEVHVIPRSEFNHGATRNLAFELNPWADVVIFQTQDALLESEHSLRALVRTFDEPKVAAAYGRQLPRPGAGPIEEHARLFNYPNQDQMRGLSDVGTLGFRSIFISNSFAAYRATAYRAVGGFANNVIVGEDTHLVARLLMANWYVSYCSSARVYHSHDYSIRQEFSRYFDTGVFHAREPWLRANFGGTGGEGAKFVRSEIEYLWSHSPGHLPSALMRTVAKYCGYRLGMLESLMSPSLKRKLSMHSFYWAGKE